MKREDLQSMKYVELYLVADYSEVRGQPWISAEKPLLSLHVALPRCGHVRLFLVYHINLTLNLAKGSSSHVKQSGEKNSTITRS